MISIETTLQGDNWTPARVKNLLILFYRAKGSIY